MDSLAPPKPTPHDELEALIKEARARQMRRKLLGAAVVATAAAVALGIYAVATWGTSNRSAKAASPTAAPLCQSSQLSASFFPGGAAGLALEGLVVDNIARRACSLPVERPAVHVVFREKALRTKERSWGSDQQFGARASHVLGPGKKAFFEIGWRGWCPNPTAAPESRHATLLLGFRGGPHVAVAETAPDRFVSLPGCGEAVHPTPWIAVSALLRYP